MRGQTGSATVSPAEVGSRHSMWLRATPSPTHCAVQPPCVGKEMLQPSQARPEQLSRAEPECGSRDSPFGPYPEKRVWTSMACSWPGPRGQGLPGHCHLPGVASLC